MKKIASYILIMCLVGVSAYAGMSAIQETDTFAENALKEGSFPLTFQHSTTNAWSAGGGKVQSTNQTDNSEGWFSTTFELTFDATLSFEWYVNSEYSDRLVFYVDGRGYIEKMRGIQTDLTKRRSETSSLPRMPSL